MATISSSNYRILDTGDLFPKLDLNLASGEAVSLPSGFGERWNILLFYRGHW